MSSQAGMDFGDKHQEKYAKVIDTWTNKVDNVSEVSKKLEGKWGATLLDTLAEPLIEALTSKDALGQWEKAGVKLPSKEALKMFSEIAAKYSLAYASPDLLRRLVISVKNDKANPPETTDKALTAALRVVRPSELATRSPQTVAQIFDMAKDRFNSVLNRFLQRDSQFTGRRQWVTEGSNSRHSNLNNQIRDEGDSFTYKKQDVQGPRPVGGNPADWSNCSCRIQYEKSNGKWVDVTD